MPDQRFTTQDTGLYSEVYGVYYDCVQAILRQAINGGVTRAQIRSLVFDKAFGESGEIIEPNVLPGGSWPLLEKQGDRYVTTLPAVPQRPLTTLQKRWLKTLLADPRIRLFGDTEQLSRGLTEVTPLFSSDKVKAFDRYRDGDPYEDEGYIQRFRVLLQAIREHRVVMVDYHSRKGLKQQRRVSPYALEYSPQDDRFRLLCYGEHNTLVVSGIAACSLCEPYDPARMHRQENNNHVVVEVTDSRNALDRTMQEFAWMQKETVRIPGTNRYRMTLHYRRQDENGLLIRLLAFGPMLRVLEPQAFVDKLRDRIARQLSLTPPMDD